VDKVGKILVTVVSRQPRSPTFVEARLKLALAAVLGQDLAAGCRSVEARGGTLWITTSNAALAHQLRTEAEHLVSRLNQESLLRPKLRRLQVVAADRPPPYPPQRPGAPAEIRGSRGVGGGRVS
jgi:hypothetical protein